jgi:hypothetical protein
MNRKNIAAGAVAGGVVAIVVDGVLFSRFTSGGPAAWVMLPLAIPVYCVFLVIGVLAGMAGAPLLITLVRARARKPHPKNMEKLEPGGRTAALGGTLGSFIVLGGLLLVLARPRSPNRPHVDYSGSFTPYPRASSPPKLPATDEALSIFTASFGKTGFNHGTRRSTAGNEDDGVWQQFSPGTDKYAPPYSIDSSEREFLAYIWCASTPDVLANNLKDIRLIFTLDGTMIPASSLATYDSTVSDVTGLLDRGDMTTTTVACRHVFTVLDQWPAGMHSYSIKATLAKMIYDGVHTYQPGDYVTEWMVNVNP